MKVVAPRANAGSVSASTSSAQSAALSGQDLMIGADVAFHIVFGANPTATTNSTRIPADTLIPFTSINPGEKFAVILATGSGTVQFSPLV